MSDSEDSAIEETEAVTDISDSKVLTKYKTAADIANKALALAVSLVAVGKNLLEVCEAADKFIVDATSKIYNKPKLGKGIAFPCAISVNHVVGHFSPLEDTYTFAEDDVVKIDLGAQVDGYIAVAAHTIVLGAVTGKVAACMMAAWTSGEAALRLLKPGMKNTDITTAIGKIAKDFEVQPVMGVVSHQLEQNVINGENVISSREDSDKKTEEVEFEPNQVYAIDMVFSTGGGKPYESDQKTTIYKRDPDKIYKLKRTTSKQVFSTIKKEHPYFPFNLRVLDKKTRGFGIKECAEHGLLEPYPVLFEKEGETVVHFKYTALITATGTVKITGVPLDVSAVKTDLAVTDKELKQLLATSAGGKKKKRKKKKKK